MPEAKEKGVSGSDQGGVQSLERAHRLLETLAGNGKAGIRDLSRTLDLPKSTVHRLLSALASIGYVEQEPTSRDYRIAGGLVALVARSVGRFGLNQDTRFLLEQLAEEVDETVYLAVRSRAETVYLERRGSEQALGMNAQVGSRAPLHATAGGKALLAWLQPSQIRAILGPEPLQACTTRTMVGYAQLDADLATARKLGYAVDSGERYNDIRAVGAPVRDFSGAVVAAVTIAGPLQRLSPERISDIGPLVAAAANQIAESLGDRKPP